MSTLEAKSVKDLSVEELKNLIASTVREVLEDEVEDRVALKSSAYVASIAEAREDYTQGRTQTLGDLLTDV